jgi:hypothetical protein
MTRMKKKKAMKMLKALILLRKAGENDAANDSEEPSTDDTTE